ncbi:receptor like protein 21-like [Miscanthus floridulus]|uniref:receptor like protein 21-like n=1 Tax=Miscanthus floridulus TaxID=154761 RepID=UPI00345847D9
MLAGAGPPDLSHLKDFNLSHNSLDGLIPAALANMSDIESLDLSHNQLSGAIPSQLSRLSSLAVFSVSYNNLSGCVPDTGQLGSFDATSYVGNRDLEEASRGSECAAGSEPPDASSPPSQHSGDEAADAVLYAVSAASFVSSFWVTVGFMFCHPYGRHVLLKL